MTVPMSRSLQCSYSSVCCRCAVVGLALLVSACGGDGTAPSQSATAQPPLAAPAVAYSVPVYVQAMPGYAQGTQQPVQGWVMQQQLQPQGQMQLQPQGQMQLQPQGQMQMQPQVAPAPASAYSDNPWASQAQQQRYANSWASSQPWSPTTGQSSGAAVTGRYRPLEGEAQPSVVTPPVVTPYDQAYGSSKRPLPTTPSYGGYAGAYPGQYAGVVPGGYGGGYPGGWPGGYGGGYPGGWPGGYGGGYPGGWPGGYGGGFPGSWPGGGYGGGFPGMIW